MKAKFNVMVWDFNHDQLKYYDILPYLREHCKIDSSLEELKKSIEEESRYEFWARCEYEMIIHGWPVRKNEYKLDVHDQIMMNIDVIANILYNEQR